MKIMKVIDQRHPEYVAFENLEEGSLFRLPKEAIIAIKIYPIINDMYDTINYVDVQTARLVMPLTANRSKSSPRPESKFINMVPLRWHRPGKIFSQNPLTKYKLYDILSIQNRKGND